MRPRSHSSSTEMMIYELLRSSGHRFREMLPYLKG